MRISLPSVFKRFFSVLTILGAAISPAIAQGQAQNAKNALQLYQVITYAQGVNEHCEVLSNGRMKALEVLREHITKPIRFTPAFPLLKKNDASAAGKKAWPSCLPKSKYAQQWAAIDTARLVADAVTTSIYDMKSDPKACKYDYTGIAMSRISWSFAINNIITKYKDDPRKAQYEAMRKGFAAELDKQCTANNKSEFLKPAAATMLSAENTNLFLQQKQEKKQVFTAIGSRIVSTYDAQYVGLWRSVKTFTSGANGISVEAFRTLKRSNNPFIIIPLRTPSMFGNSGRAFVGHDGVWQVKLTGDVAAVEFRLKDGKKIPFTRTKKGSYLEKSEFTLSPAGIEALDSAAGSERISVFYSKDGSKWSDYKSYKSQAGQISLEQLRAAIKWATAPFSREYEKQ